MMGFRPASAAFLGILLAAAAAPGQEGPPMPPGGRLPPEEPPPVKEVTLPTEDGLTLRADLYEPGGGGEGKPAIVALHGEKGSRAAWRVLGPRIAEHGMTLLALDLRGHGGSRATEGTDLGPRAEEGDPALWKEAAEDAAAGLKYLRGTLLADGKRLGLVGLGAGTALALVAAEKDERVAAVFGVHPSPSGCGLPGHAALVRWDGRPVGYVVGEADARGEAAAMERGVRKLPRVDAVVLPLEEKVDPEPFAGLERVALETVQFFHGWFGRKPPTGRPEEGVMHGGGIFVSGSSAGAGNEAGGVSFQGYLAPGKVDGLRILADPEPGARVLSPGSRRITVVPARGKEPAVTVVVEAWNGKSWSREKPVTLVDHGAFVVEGKTTFYEVWLPPRILGVAPFSPVAVSCRRIVGGKPEEVEARGSFGPRGGDAPPPFSETVPASWQRWELR